MYRPSKQEGTRWHDNPHVRSRLVPCLTFQFVMPIIRMARTTHRNDHVLKLIMHHHQLVYVTALYIVRLLVR